jgi:hypothetical protein
MTDRMRMARFLATATVPFALLAAPAASSAEEEVPFDTATIYFELNDSDSDLGIHGLIDGDEWRRLRIEDPNERVILNVSVLGRLGRQGLTEIFFESAEPRFSELAPADFFKRFPEGTYEVEGLALDGTELDSEVEISHVMPAPAGSIRLNGTAAAPNCSALPLPVVSAPVRVEWNEVTTSHPTVGTPGEPVEVEEYQVFLELRGTDVKMSENLPPGTTSMQVPLDFTARGKNFKLELLVRADNGNQTATETCFELR